MKVYILEDTSPKGAENLAHIIVKGIALGCQGGRIGLEDYIEGRPLSSLHFEDKVEYQTIIESILTYSKLFPTVNVRMET